MQPRTKTTRPPRTAPARPVVDPIAVDSPSRELVGWALNPERSGGLRISPEVTHRVLATALGISPETLVDLPPAELRIALDRLHALAAYTQQLAELAATDDLTGALRRGAGLAALQRELDRTQRIRGIGIVVAFFDVDGLKQVNDTDGHAAGDRVLSDVVAAIRDRVRSYDLVIRYGGDEFVCALIDEAMDDAERTIADIRRQYETRSGGHTVSVGVAAAQQGDTAEAVVARADAALYAGRRHVPA